MLQQREELGNHLRGCGLAGVWCTTVFKCSFLRAAQCQALWVSVASGEVVWKRPMQRITLQLHKVQREWNPSAPRLPYIKHTTIARDSDRQFPNTPIGHQLLQRQTLQLDANTAGSAAQAAHLVRLSRLSEIRYKRWQGWPELVRSCFVTQPAASCSMNEVHTADLGTG